MKTKRFLFIPILFVALLTSCATSSKIYQNGFAEPEKIDSKLFWKIEGTDKNGIPSAVYLQGTIHVADERAFPFSETVTEAFKNSTRIYAELSEKDMKSIELKSVGLVLKSLKKAGGRNIMNYLSDEEKQIVHNAVGESEANAYAMYEPWILTQMLTLNLYTAAGLSSTKSVDFYFYDMAKKQHKIVEGLDELQTQLDILTFGTYEEQLESLYSVIDGMNDPEKYTAELTKLYEAYISDDRETLYYLFSSDLEDSDELTEVLLDKRNKNWADQIANFLNEGGTTFVFAGSAHFLGDRSVFHYLKENGTIAEELLF